MNRSTLLRWASIFRTHEGDAIPVGLVTTGICLSAISTVLGIVYALGDFLVNVAASLAVLGPGLAITNIAVRSWRHAKNREQVKPSFAQLVRGFYLLLGSVSHLLESTRGGVGAVALKADDIQNAGSLLVWLRKAEEVLDQRMELINSGRRPGKEPEIPITRKLLELPDLRLVEALATGINAIHPVPAAVVAATFLSHAYSSAPFVTIYRVSPPPGVTSTQDLRMQSACLGFHQLRIVAIEHDAHVDDPKLSPMTVLEILYVDCLKQLTHHAVKTLESLMEEMPPVQSAFWASLAPATRDDS